MNAVNKLAARYGIEESYLDARGRLQTTTPETRQALLAAMGVQANTEEAAVGALEQLDREEWLRPLPSAHVALEAAPISVPITYASGTDLVTWRLSLESGEERSGKVQFESLKLLHRQQLDDQTYERRFLPLGTIPSGYHRLTLTPGEAASILIVSPGKCWLPPELEQGKRLWGVAAQLYLLKSAHNWGIGDFSDLRSFAQVLINRGAQVIGLNPLHAMFIDAPEHASPYSPASRLLLNILNLDVMTMAETTGCAKALGTVHSRRFQRTLQDCRESALVNYTKVMQLKLPILRMIYESWLAKPEASRWVAFEAFRSAATDSFLRSCLFMALREFFSAQTPALPDWRDWPVEFRDPDSKAVRQFAEDQKALVTFHTWLQFMADTQLGEAARAAEPMAIGLYRDLAVGADPSGSETWNNQQSVVTLAQVGAPPDIYNPAGQDWGLPPFHPMALQREGYRSFIELVRANMRHAGGLRIDHVMALQQLYWIPRGSTAAQGAYVRYPREDLIGILALESHRNRCLVVGEDLGTVPAGFRERMSDARILSYRVLFFEKEEGEFVSPDRYPPLSLAVAGSHDLPTLTAWMAADDLALKEKLGLFPNEKLRTDAHLDRSNDRQALLAAFGERGLVAEPAMPVSQFTDAAHGFLASSASAITLVQIDDITHESAPVNVPATSTQHPNWRRRLSMSLEEIADDPQFQALARSLNETRASDSPANTSSHGRQ